jgi:GDPmannose 4,6-dehydratase
MKKKALITGITGQDGSYLAELLIAKDYEVHGLVRAMDRGSFNRINHIKERLILHSGSLEDYPWLLDVFTTVQPDECYHLAAQTVVGDSFTNPFLTYTTNINGTLHVLEALRVKSPNCRFFFAGTTEMFGQVEESPQKEDTPFHPCSPYGISKLAGHQVTGMYRQVYDIFACSGILFNHESPRRGPKFVTRVVSQQVAKIKKGLDNVLILGNLKTKRDWGFAGDYVQAMWLMLQQSKPDDYVIATGQGHSIKELVEESFRAAGLKWTTPVINIGLDQDDKKILSELRKDKSQIYVVEQARFRRPIEIGDLVGDPSKAKAKLGWQATTTFEEIVAMLVNHDLKDL